MQRIRLVIVAILPVLASCTQAVTALTPAKDVVAYCTSYREPEYGQIPGKWTLLGRPPGNAPEFRRTADPSRTLDPTKATYDERWLTSGEGDLLLCFVGERSGCYKYLHLFPGGSPAKMVEYNGGICSN
jgi:hypothetical protein